jgi:hypothetical protein
MNAFASYLDMYELPFVFQSDEVNPPNINELVVLMIVSVFRMLPHLEWKLFALNPSTLAL